MARLKVTGSDDFMLIDMTTGTVLGSNVVAIFNPEGKFTEDELEDISSSDELAFRAGQEHGETLYTM